MGLNYSKEQIYLIKSLKWEELNPNKWVAKTKIGSFYIEAFGADANSFHWWCNNSENTTKKTSINFQLAKYDAQAEFESMLKTMLINVVAVMSRDGKSVDIIKPIEEIVEDNELEESL